MPATRSGSIPTSSSGHSPPPPRFTRGSSLFQCVVRLAVLEPGLLPADNRPDQLLEPGPPGDDDPDGDGPLPVEGGEVVEVPVVERVLVVPLHLDRQPGERVPLADPGHVDLMAPDPGDLPHVVVETETLGDGDVPLAPDLATAVELRPERVVEPAHEHGPAPTAGPELVEADPEAGKRSHELAEPGGEGAGQDHVGVPGDAVDVPGRQAGDAGRTDGAREGGVDDHLVKREHAA